MGSSIFVSWILTRYLLKLCKLVKAALESVLIQASYGIEDPEFAITQLAQTTMRSEIGKISLDMLFKVK